MIADRSHRTSSEPAPRGQVLGEGQRENVESGKLAGSTTSSALRNEAIAELSKAPEAKTGKINNRLPPLELKNGDYWVKSGDTLSKIAQRSLNMRGEKTDDWSSVKKEMARIIEDNKKWYPQLAKNADRLHPNMILTVQKPAEAKVETKPVEKEAAKPAEEELVIDCASQPWLVAQPGAITNVQKCQKVTAGENAQVIVQPGGHAILEKGSRGFIFEGGSAEVRAGAMAINAKGSLKFETGARITDIQVVDEGAQPVASAYELIVPEKIESTPTAFNGLSYHTDEMAK